MMTTKQAAQYLGISVYYLRNLRHLLHQHDGPEYTEGPHLNGIACYYTKEGLDRWAAQHRWRKTRSRVSKLDVKRYCA